MINLHQGLLTVRFFSSRRGEDLGDMRLAWNRTLWYFTASSCRGGDRREERKTIVGTLLHLSNTSLLFGEHRFCCLPQKCFKSHLLLFKVIALYIVFLLKNKIPNFSITCTPGLGSRACRQDCTLHRTKLVCTRYPKKCNHSKLSHFCMKFRYASRSGHI